MPFIVTRQFPYYQNMGEEVPLYSVEISSGPDGAGPDMLCKKYRDEGDKVLDPHEATDYAIKIAAAWKKDMRAGKAKKGRIQIVIGSPGISGIESTDPVGKNDLKTWADKISSTLPRCAFHGDVIDISDRDVVCDRDFEQYFCDQNAYELEMERREKELLE